MRVLLTHSLSGAAIAPPQLSWQLVVIQAADASRVVDPVLALARDDVVHFYQVLLFYMINNFIFIYLIQYFTLKI